MLKKYISNKRIKVLLAVNIQTNARTDTVLNNCIELSKHEQNQMPVFLFFFLSIIVLHFKVYWKNVLKTFKILLR